MLRALVIAVLLSACDEEQDPSTSPECVDARARYITAKFHFEEGVRAGWSPTMVSAQRALLDRFVSANWQCFK